MTIINLKPMLAVSADDHLDDLVYPLLGSFKMDGIRCLMAPEGSGAARAVSRTLKPIPNHHIRNALEANLFAGKDGELGVLGDDGQINFRASTSAVMSRAGEPDFRYCIFDNFLIPGSFEERLERLFEAAPLTWSPPSWLVVVEQRLLRNAAEVRAMFAEAIKLGAEGLILRCPKAAYKFNRSTLKEQGMLKVKPWKSAEALIKDILPEYENTNEQLRDERGYAKRSTAKAGKVLKEGKAGVVVVEDLSQWPKPFEIGTGFDDATKRWLWEHKDRLIGKAYARFSYLDIGGYDVPRSCSWDGIRDPRDMGEPSVDLKIMIHEDQLE